MMVFAAAFLAVLTGAFMALFGGPLWACYGIGVLVYLIEVNAS